MGTSQILPMPDSPRRPNKSSPLSLSQILPDNSDVLVRHLDETDLSFAERNPLKVLHNRYLKGPCIARGSFAVVKEAYDLSEDRIVAIKVFKVCLFVSLSSFC